MPITLNVCHNGDDVLLTWKSSKKIPECRGFAVYRRRNGQDEPLDSYAGFEDEQWTRGEHRPSTVWPIQKYMWTDYLARTGDTVRYRVVPMIGDHRNGMTELTAEASTWSRSVTLDPHVSPAFACYFNRGIVATQWVQRMLGKDLKLKDRAKSLDNVIVDLNNPKRRNLLAGELREGLLALLRQAQKEGLHVRAALFELTDQELMSALAAIGSRATVVLADGAIEKKKKTGQPPDDNDVPATKRPVMDENAGARTVLRSHGVDVQDRMTHGKFLAHNKILVVSTKNNVPRWTWTGSTNWTASGLCTQANNGILIDDERVASTFGAQVDRLALADDGSPAALAKSNSSPTSLKVGRSSTTIWFTRTNNEVDLVDARNRIAAAHDGALFLMFQAAATKSLLEAIMERRTEPDFYVHGVISSPPEEGGKKKKGAGSAKTKHKRKLTAEEAIARRVAFVHHNERIRYAPDLLLPFALPFAKKETERWFAEFVKKNGAHAIVHSKIIVLDPFGKIPVVMTGSHNMGTTASKKNDENLLIVERDRDLAAAYAVNIMSIYNNYRWRYRVAQGSTWKGLHNHDRWQDDYLKGAKRGELDFWA